MIALLITGYPIIKSGAIYDIIIDVTISIAWKNEQIIGALTLK
jgi:hypothetical protein